MAEPTKQPPRRDTWARVVLLVAFVGAGVVTLAESSDRASVLLKWGKWVVVALAILGAFALWFIWQRRSVARFAPENDEGLELLARGELERAREHFASLLVRVQSTGPARDIALFNLAWIELLGGDLVSARQHWNLIEIDRPRGADMGLYGDVPARLALVDALQGDETQARRWIEESRKRNAERKPHAPAAAAFEVASEAVLHLRAARPRDASRMLEGAWTSLESAITGEIVAFLRVLRAFAFEAIGDAPSRQRAGELLVAARDARTPQLDYLGVAWPEMRAFLDRSRLSRAPEGSLRQPSSSA